MNDISPKTPRGRRRGARSGLRLRRSRHLPRRLRLERLEDRCLLATNVSGAIAADTTWTKAAGPYIVTGDVTVAAAATLRIQAGVDVQFMDNAGITLAGRMLAEGTAWDRIRFRREANATGRWDGIHFQNTLADSRISYADWDRGDVQGNGIFVDHSRLTIDNMTWTNMNRTVIEVEHPSLIVRNSHFPNIASGEVVHGENIAGNEYLILDGNLFDASTSGDDVVDFLGAERPGPVFQVLNNVFMGGGDDGIDLDGTDAHVEGNLFMNFHKATSRATTSNAIATGLPQTGGANRTEITVVRNIFFDCDHAILLKEDAQLTSRNNVFVGMDLGVVQLNEVGGTAVQGPGLGATFDGDIFWNNVALVFKNVTTQTVTVDRSMIPANEAGRGVGNSTADPMFVDNAADFHLRPGSPAIGTGPDGLDRGAYVPGGPVLHGLPTSPVPQSSVSLTVGGPGITGYRWRVDGGTYSAATPVATPIQFFNLTSGAHTIDVQGSNSAGEWFAASMPAFGTRRAEIIAPARTKNNELLPIVVRVRDSHGQIHAQVTTPATFANAADLVTPALRVKRGIGTLSTVVAATAPFVLQLPPLADGTFAGSSGRNVAVAASFPTQSYSGTLAGDTVWDNTADRVVTGNLTIPAGSKLTIQPGTRVLLGDKVGIRVEGEIVAGGTAAEPIAFLPNSRALPWGGIELVGAIGAFNYTFFTAGGADASKAFGHSASQPVLMVDNSTLNCGDCFIVNNPGKALGARNNSRLNLDRSVISNVDTGGQLDDSVIHFTDSMIKDVPNDDGAFVDDDNDGAYFAGVHSSGEASTFERSTVLTTKDDCIDHAGARLQIVSSWLEGCTHEGVAGSTSNSVTIDDSVVTRANQGVEAGYGSPQLTVRHSAIVANTGKIDPAQQINAGIRFGDGYDGSLGAYNGHITASDVVLTDNTDNVRNYDGSIPGPKAGAIDVTHSLTNDPDYDAATGNGAGVPVFGPMYHLLRGSAGTGTASDGGDVGRSFATLRGTFEVTGGVVPQIVTIAFQDDVLPTPAYDGTRDTWIQEASPTTNLGTNTRIAADGQTTGAGFEEWSLVKWDIRAIPIGSTVVAATLTFDVTDVSIDTFGLYPVLKNWVETEATWNQSAAGQNWSTPGAQGAADHGPQFGTLSGLNATGIHDFSLGDPGKAAVQAWINSPTTNYGLLIAGASGTAGLELRSRDSTTIPSHPKLTIQYRPADVTPPAVASSQVRLDVAPQAVRFQFTEDVAASLSAGDLAVINNATSQPIDPARMNVSFDPATMTATWTFPGLPAGRLPDGAYTATLQTASITDGAGNPLAANGQETVQFTRMAGDIDGDLAVDAADIDLLFDRYSPTDSNPIVDLDADGDVDRQDVDTLVQDILHTRYGDADLDGNVSRRDAATLSLDWGANGGWANGDFNGDNAIGVDDAALMQTNLAMAASPAAMAAVPTPVSAAAPASVSAIVGRTTATFSAFDSMSRETAHAPETPRFAVARSSRHRFSTSAVDRALEQWTSNLPASHAPSDPSTLQTHRPAPLTARRRAAVATMSPLPEERMLGGDH